MFRHRPTTPTGTRATGPAAGLLRAGRPPRRTHEHDGRQTVLADPTGSPAEQPERRRGAQRRLDLVHRPELRHRLRLRGRARRGGDRRLPRLPHRPVRHRHRGRRRLRPPQRAGFSPDESVLYVVDTRERHLRAFDVSQGGPCLGGAVLAECTAGSFDGLRLDEAGRLWVAAHDGVHVHHPSGELIGKLRVPRGRVQPVLRRPAAQPPVRDRHQLRLHAAPQRERSRPPVARHQPGRTRAAHTSSGP